MHSKEKLRDGNCKNYIYTTYRYLIILVVVYSTSTRICPFLVPTCYVGSCQKVSSEYAFRLKKNFEKSSTYDYMGY